MRTVVKFTFKLVLLGEQAVGKTSLVLRFVNNTFTDNYISTIGADFLIKDLELMGAPVRLMIWDLGGQVQWEGVRARYMQGSDGVILIYDVSRKMNIERYIFDWLKEIEDFIGKNTPIIVVGNKIDLKAQVNLKEAALLMKRLHLPYVETSAKTGNRVEAIFKKITTKIVMRKAEYVKKVKGVQESDITGIFQKIREKD